MVPVKKTQIQYEAVDYEKLTQLARFGLVDKANVNKLIAAFKKMEDGKVLAPPQRELMMNVLTDLTGIVTGDTQMFQKAKKAVKEETLDESLSPTQLEKLKKQYATTGDRISTDAAMKMNAMIKKFDKPALISLYKANIKWLSTSAMTQLISKHGMKAADLKAVSEEVESITELTAEEKRLVNTMYDKKGNLTDIGKKVMDHGKKNRFPHNTSASQGKMMSGKSTMYSEDTMDEAISGDQYYYVDPKGVVVAVGNKDSMRKMNMKQAKDGNKGGSFSQNRKKYKVGDKINESVKIDEISMGKMASYADKAVKSRNDAKAATYSADSNRRDKAQKTIVKRKAGADNYNKKMWGYSNVAPTKESVDDVQIDEARPSQRHPLEGHPYHKKTNAELEYIGKDAHKAAQAMKSHNPSAEGKYLDQANDSATVRNFRKTSGTPDWYKKKYGHSMKEEAQIDEMGAFMSSPLPTPMSMRKEPSMTKPLMLTKRMNTAATLIKKAGNTPKLPEATYSDTGWQKPKVKKDQSGNVIKTKNVAKTLAKSGLRKTKDLEAAQKAKEFTFSRVKK